MSLSSTLYSQTAQDSQIINFKPKQTAKVSHLDDNVKIAKLLLRRKFNFTGINEIGIYEWKPIFLTASQFQIGFTLGPSVVSVTEKLYIMSLPIRNKETHYTMKVQTLKNQNLPLKIITDNLKQVKPCTCQDKQIFSSIH